MLKVQRLRSCSTVIRRTNVDIYLVHQSYTEVVTRKRSAFTPQELNGRVSYMVRCQYNNHYSGNV